MSEYTEQDENSTEMEIVYHGRPKGELDELKKRIKDFSCSKKANSEGPCLSSIQVKTLILASVNLNADQVDACILTALSKSGFEIFDIISHYGKGHPTENFFKKLLTTESLFSPSEAIAKMRTLLIRMSTRQRLDSKNRPKYLLTAAELAELASC